jgi:hypothetical protein
VRGCLLVQHKPLQVVKSIVHEEEKIHYSSSLSLSVNRSSLSMFCEVVENISALAIFVLLAKPEFLKLALY